MCSSDLVSRTVIWLLRSRDVNVRRMATEVIRSVPDPEQSLWPKLISVLRDEDWWVRERVMDALVELGGQRLTPHIAQMLADKSDVIRRFAVNVLGRLKDPKALRSLNQPERLTTYPCLAMPNSAFDSRM